MTDAVDVVNAYLDGITNLNADACVALFADGCIISMPCAPAPFPKEVSDHAQINAMFHHLMENVLRRLDWIERTIIPCKDIELVVAKLKSDGELQDGGLYNNDYCKIIRVRNGRIIEYTEFNDPIRTGALVHS